jgi:hypothetical protein
MRGFVYYVFCSYGKVKMEFCKIYINIGVSFISIIINYSDCNTHETWV